MFDRTGQEVGVAWLSQVCTTRAISSQGEYTSGTGVSSVSKLFFCILLQETYFFFFKVADEWKVVAHEIGHGFGKEKAIRFFTFFFKKKTLKFRCDS